MNRATSAIHPKSAIGARFGRVLQKGANGGFRHKQSIGDGRTSDRIWVDSGHARTSAKRKLFLR